MPTCNLRIWTLCICPGFSPEGRVTVSRLASAVTQHRQRRPRQRQAHANQGVFALANFWIHGFLGEAGASSVTSFLNGVEVESIAFVTSAEWQSIGANFALVDQVVINGYGNYLVDDVSASAVPEPASVALFGLGPAGFVALRRKKA